MGMKETKEFLTRKMTNGKCGQTRRALQRILLSNDGSLIPLTNSESFIQWQANTTLMTETSHCQKSQKSVNKAITFFSTDQPAFGNGNIQLKVQFLVNVLQFLCVKESQNQGLKTGNVTVFMYLTKLASAPCCF